MGGAASVAKFAYSCGLGDGFTWFYLFVINACCIRMRMQSFLQYRLEHQDDVSIAIIIGGKLRAFNEGPNNTVIVESTKQFVGHCTHSHEQALERCARLAHQFAFAAAPRQQMKLNGRQRGQADSRRTRHHP